MKRLSVVSILVLALALPLFANPDISQTWQNVPVVDTMCYSKVKDNPDGHTKKCLIECAKSGFGIIDAEGNYLKLDTDGNAKVLDLVKKSDKKEGLRLDVTGERRGDTILVTSVSMSVIK